MFMIFVGGASPASTERYPDHASTGTPRLPAGVL